LVLPLRNENESVSEVGEYERKRASAQVNCTTLLVLRKLLLRCFGEAVVEVPEVVVGRLPAMRRVAGQ
jgi:hypothetical protein